MWWMLHSATSGGIAHIQLQLVLPSLTPLLQRLFSRLCCTSSLSLCLTSAAASAAARWSLAKVMEKGIRLLPISVASLFVCLPVCDLLAQNVHTLIQTTTHTCIVHWPVKRPITSRSCCCSCCSCCCCLVYRSGPVRSIPFRPLCLFVTCFCQNWLYSSAHLWLWLSCCSSFNSFCLQLLLLLLLLLFLFTF